MERTYSGLGAKGVLERVPFLLHSRTRISGVYAPMRAALPWPWSRRRRRRRMREHVRDCRSLGWGYAAAASKRRVAPGKRMRGRLHDPASAHATSSPANSRDNLLPPRIESQTCLVPAFLSCFLESSHRLSAIPHRHDVTIFFLFFFLFPEK